jgi:hypothetical protein
MFKMSDSHMGLHLTAGMVLQISEIQIARSAEVIRVYKLMSQGGVNISLPADMIVA